MQLNENIIIVVPTYQPSKHTFFLAKKLVNLFRYIIFVDDGSRKELKNLFNQISEIGDIDVLQHLVNEGKGKSIKDAILFGLEKYSNEISNRKIIGFLTCDSDGQHSIDDICKCADELKFGGVDLVLGTRVFTGNNIPIRSKFGNELTSKLLYMTHSLLLKDTQTGLRCFNIDFAKNIKNLYGNRYEYEINMLIYAKKNNYTIKEVDIDTIYIDNNSESHFNPIVDSIKIYTVVFSEFIKYLLVAIISFACDILIFLILSKILYNKNYFIYFSSFGARFVSSVINYLLNSSLVFENKKNSRIVKYYLLVFFNMILSAYLVNNIYILLKGNLLIIKFFIDILIFVLNYFINKMIVFKN